MGIVHFFFHSTSNLLDGLEVGQLGKGAGLGEELLVEETAEGNHGKAAVLHLN